MSPPWTISIVYSIAREKREEKEARRRSKSARLYRAAFSLRSGTRMSAQRVTGLKIETDVRIIHVVTFQRRPCYVHRRVVHLFFSATVLLSPMFLVVFHYFDDSHHYSKVCRLVFFYYIKVIDCTRSPKFKQSSSFRNFNFILSSVIKIFIVYTLII